MTRIFGRLILMAAACVALVLVLVTHSASALDTPNTLMGVDGMVLRAGGLFRDPGSFGDVNGNDGFNTFQFGTFTVNNSITTGLGKYDAIRFQKNGTGDCCISHNARFNSNSPETVIDPTATPPAVSTIGGSINANFFPVIDRAAFGQVFNPAEYQIQVKVKPLLTQATANSLGVNPFPSNPSYPNIPASLENTAATLTVGLDQLGGYVWDAEGGRYKRAGEQMIYNIGTAATPLNTWYVTAPKDSDGFATYTVPVTSPSFSHRSFYYSYGSGDFRATEVVTNGGRVFNAESGAWEDSLVGYGAGFQNFGGGPSEPGNPSSKLNVPNGVTVMAFGAPADTVGLNVEVKSVALKRINPSPIMARIDANSGVSFRFGSGFTYGASQPAINVPGVGALNPLATDQISRFDQNGMTNLTFNMRTPDNVGEVHRFLVRGAPSEATFDGTTATVNVRAKLLQSLSNPEVAKTLTIYLRGRKGNDDAATKGADHWEYALDLSQFNTSTMTTVAIPLSAFTRNMNVSTLGPPPGFANHGDGLLTNFGLYEFGGQIAAGGGLLKLEMEYMEVRLASQALVGDYNSDGKVDAADYTVWRDRLGAAGSTLGSNRDPANSGVVSQADFNSWKAHFGQMAGSGSLAAGAVPEPATLSLLVGMLGLAACRRRAA